ncbi:MAG: ice-binding family protein [Halobacteriales archaeon]|nr:ice-binding family protein [Halobacteriales archaeon]
MDLGTAGDYRVLAKSGISTVPDSAVAGNIGVSPIDSTALTGFSLTMDSSGEFATSDQVSGRVFASDYASPTPSKLTTAVSDMETAYNDAAGRTNPDTLDTGGGTLGGETFSPGLHRWGTAVTITDDIYLDGGPNDVFIFQISDTLTLASDKEIVLQGGARAENIYWQVADRAELDTGSRFNGNILGKTGIDLRTGASVNGGLYAQTDVNLEQATVKSQDPAEGADLEVNKSVNESAVNVSDTVEFTVNLTNNGPENATGVTVTDDLPNGLTLENSSVTQGSYDAATGNWTVGDLDGNQTETLTLTVNVSQAGTYTNTASITESDQDDFDQTNNVDTATVTAGDDEADLAVNKLVDKLAVNVGETFEFTVNLTNNGPDNATGVTVKDLLPNGLTLLNSSVTQGSYDASTGIWTVGDLDGNQTETLVMEVQGDAIGTYKNTAAIRTSDQVDSDLTNNADSASIIVSSFIETTIPEPDEECIDRRNISRGEEDDECPHDRDIRRGETREDLDERSGRSGRGDHRDSATERRNRGR